MDCVFMPAPTAPAVNDRFITPTDAERAFIRDTNALIDTIRKQKRDLEPLFEALVIVMRKHCERLLPMTSGYYQSHGNIPVAPIALAAESAHHLHGHILSEVVHESTHFVGHSSHYGLHLLETAKLLHLGEAVLGAIPVLSLVLCTVVKALAMQKEHDLQAALNAQLGRLSAYSNAQRDNLYHFIAAHMVLHPSTQTSVLRDKPRVLSTLLWIRALAALTSLPYNEELPVETLGKHWHTVIATHAFSWNPEPLTLPRNITTELHRWIEPYIGLAASDKTLAERRADFLTFFRKLCFFEEGVNPSLKTTATLHATHLAPKARLVQRTAFYRKVEEHLTSADTSVALNAQTAWATSSYTRLRDASQNTITPSAWMQQQISALTDAIAQLHTTSAIKSGWSPGTRSALEARITTLNKDLPHAMSTTAFLDAIAARRAQTATSLEDDRWLNIYLTAMLHHYEITTDVDERRFCSEIIRGLFALGGNPLDWMETKIKKQPRQVVLATDSGPGFFLAAEQATLILSHLQYRATHLGECSVYLNQYLDTLIQQTEAFAKKLHACVESDHHFFWRAVAAAHLPVPQGLRRERSVIYWAMLRYLYVLLNEALTPPPSPEIVVSLPYSTILFEAQQQLEVAKAAYHSAAPTNNPFINQGFVALQQLEETLTAMRNALESLRVMRQSYLLAFPQLTNTLVPEDTRPTQESKPQAEIYAADAKTQQQEATEQGGEARLRTQLEAERREKEAAQERAEAERREKEAAQEREAAAQRQNQTLFNALLVQHLNNVLRELPEAPSAASFNTAIEKVVDAMLVFFKDRSVASMTSEILSLIQQHEDFMGFRPLLARTDNTQPPALASLSMFANAASPGATAHVTTPTLH